MQEQSRGFELGGEVGFGMQTPVSEGALARAVYLGTEPDPIFAMVHEPTSIRPGVTGVLLCPPFGWDDMCTYRVRRAWANALARAGHPAIRIDLPGTNDSAGSPRDPERLAAWTSAVAGAAGWLRDEYHCGRIAGLGIGLGGTVAWLAAAQGAPIDDLLLWAVPTRGDQLLRHIRAAALINIDHRVDSDGIPNAGLGDGGIQREDAGLVEMSGRLITNETIASLAHLDLTKLSLADSTRRRVLLFARAKSAADKRVSDHFKTSGAELTVASGDAYGAMMQYTPLARVPDAALKGSISWLAQGEDPRRQSAGSAAGRTGNPVQTLPALELCHDGVPIRETPLRIDLGSESAFAILTEPIAAGAADSCAVLFNAGSDRRTGPCRMWVETARRWAARGIPTVRLDQPGIGDADGEHSYAKLAAYYDPRITSRTTLTLDHLEARGLPSRFVLVGFCSGGHWALNAALADPRVAGVFTINLPFFFWNWWSRRVLHGWWVHRKRRPDDPLMIVGILSTLRRVSRIFPVIRRMFLRVRPGGSDRLVRALSHLRDQGTELLFLFRPGEPLYDDLLADGRMERIRQMPNVRVAQIPGTDHGFRPLALQSFVSGQLDAALARVVQSDHVGGPPKLTLIHDRKQP